MSGRRAEDTRLLGGLVAGGAVLLLTFLASVLVASPARAHTGLVEAAPPDGAAVAAPRQVVLTFASELDRSLAVVRLTGPSGPVDLPSGPEVSGRRVVQEVGALPAGEHRLRFRVVARDGHPVAGETAFTVRRGTPAAADTGSAAPGPAIELAPAGTGLGTAASGPPARSTGSGSAAGLPAAAGAVLVLLIAGLLVLRRPGTRGAADDGQGRA